MQINIFDFIPREKVIVNVDKDLLKVMFDKMNCKTLEELSHKLGGNIRNVSRYRCGTRGMPCSKFLKLVDSTKMRLEEFQNKITIRISKGGTALQLGPFVSIDENWIYISELIRGDGHIPPSMWSVQFINKEKSLIDIVKKFFIKNGIPESSIEVRKPKTGIYHLYIRSAIMAYILNKFFENPTGNKSAIIRLPNFIKSDKNFACAAVKGFFDAEGSVKVGTRNHLTPRRITIASKSLFYLEDLKNVLNSLSIESRIRKESKKELYRLFITHQNNLRKFHEIIGSNHPVRKRKLEQLLKTFLATRHPEGDLRLRVLDSIKNGNKKRVKIMEHLNISHSSAGWQLKWLKSQNLIEISHKVYTNRGSYYEYDLTEDGSDALIEHRSFSNKARQR